MAVEELQKKGCQCELGSLNEVHLLRENDVDLGYTVLFTTYGTESSPATKTDHEAFIAPVAESQQLAMGFTGATAARISSISVGTEWDNKEIMFRRHGGLLGIEDEFVACWRGSKGDVSSVDFNWVDPSGEVVASDTCPLVIADEYGHVISPTRQATAIRY